MNDKKESFWASLNKVLKTWPNERASDDIIFIKSDGEGTDDSAPRSASAKLTQQKHSDKNSTSSLAAFKHGQSKTGTAGHSGHLAHLAPSAKPKPPTLPQRPKPVMPMAPLKPLHQLNFIKPKV